MRPLRTLVLFALSLAAMACVPGAAQAALPVTFSAQSAGTTLTNQYAADGVTFTDPTGTSGLPVVSTSTTPRSNDGKVATTTCVGCEFDDRDLWISLSTLAQSVTLHGGLVNAGSADLTFTALGANHAVIGSVNFPVTGSSYRTAITMTAPGAQGIAYLRLKVPDGRDFGIDDLDLTPTGGGPDFSLFPAVDRLTLREGTSGTIPLNILRLNGSTGGVTITQSLVPSGVTVTNPAPSNAGTTANVGVSAALGTNIVNGTVRMVGSPDGAAAGTANRTGEFALTVEPSFKLRSDVANDLVTPCAPRERNLVVSRASVGFNGTIGLTAEASDGYAATLDRTSLTNDAASHLVRLTITTTRSDPPEHGTVTIRGTATGASNQELVVPIDRAAPTITGFTPTTANTPRDVRPGTTVTITGTGLCAGSLVQFGNSVAEVSSFGAAPDGTSIMATVPRLGTTGPITVRTPGQSVTSATSLVVNSPRSAEGFKFVNYDHPGVDLGALTNVYGETQTHLSIDPCNPLPGVIPPICPIPTPIPNPLVAIYIGVSNAALAGKASCFGISVTSSHIATGVVPRSAFTPASAQNVWDLDAFSSPGPALAQRIKEWHTTQLSSEYLGYWIDHAAENVSNSGRGSLGVLNAELGAGRHPLVSIRFGNAGHAMIAYGVRPGPTPGSYDVDVYDPNAPLQPAELTNGTLHQARTDASVIHVDASGHWTFSGQFDPAWSGGSDQMVVAPMSVFGARPTMPTDPHGFVRLLVPMAADGKSSVAQVTGPGGKELLGDDGQLNPDPSKRPANGAIAPTITGDGGRAMYAFQGGRTPTTITLRGTAAGTTGVANLGPGFATQVTGLQTAAGSTDVVRVDPGQSSLTIDAGKGGAVQGTIAGEDVSVQFKLAGADRGRHRTSLAAGDFTYVNASTGAATISSTATTTGRDGTPGSLTLPSLTVPAGGKLVVDPPDWARLMGSNVLVTVRDKRGRVISRRTVRASASTWARSVKLSVGSGKTRTRKVTVSARFVGVPKGATTTVGVHVRVGKKIISTQQQQLTAAQARGQRSTTFTVELPAGRSTVYGTATVVSKAAASSARASRTLSVR